MNPVRNINQFRSDRISNGVKITIRNLQKKIPVSPKRIKRAILNLLASEGIKKSGEITVCFVTDRKIRALNKKYLGKDYATDVLAFDTGDVVVSADTAVRNAGIFKTSSRHELELYAIHGILHLLGYDDRTPAKLNVMRSKERKYVHT